MAFAVTGAWATQVSQTKKFSGVPDFEKTLTFGKVNLCPDCTVNWIKVILALNVNGGQYILDNDADSPASGSFNFGGKVQIIGSDVAMIDAVFNPVVGIVQAGHSGSFNLQANVGMDLATIARILRMEWSTMAASNPTARKGSLTQKFLDNTLA